MQQFLDDGVDYRDGKFIQKLRKMWYDRFMAWRFRVFGLDTDTSPTSEQVFSFMASVDTLLTSSYAGKECISLKYMYNLINCLIHAFGYDYQGFVLEEEHRAYEKLAGEGVLNRGVWRKPEAGVRGNYKDPHCMVQKSLGVWCTVVDYVLLCA